MIDYDGQVCRDGNDCATVDDSFEACDTVRSTEQSRNDYDDVDEKQEGG